MDGKFESVSFERLDADNTAKIAEMSRIATAIVRDYYDPILGTAQNDYMLNMFQSEAAIKEQLLHGVSYYFMKGDGRNVGFFAFYPKEDYLYLSKFYIEAGSRGCGAGRKTLDFLVKEGQKLGLGSIRLNVNKNNASTIGFYEAVGFKCIRSEKNDIGNGFYMDDYVYKLDI